MIWSFLFFLSLLAHADVCRVHTLRALENPILLSTKDKAKIAKPSPAVADLAKEFSLTLGSICAGEPCGKDPRVDQAARDQVNTWIKKAEKLKDTDQKTLKNLIRAWIRVEIGFLTKEGWDKSQVELRKSRIAFFDARFAERKSPFKDLFCLE